MYDIAICIIICIFAHRLTRPPETCAYIQRQIHRVFGHIMLSMRSDDYLYIRHISISLNHAQPQTKPSLFPKKQHLNFRPHLMPVYFHHIPLQAL